jgi:cell division protein FtsB
MVSLFAQRVLPLSVLALAAVSVPVLVLSPTGLPRLRNLEEERQRAARDELGLVRTTEVVFQFSD